MNFTNFLFPLYKLTILFRKPQESLELIDYKFPKHRCFVVKYMMYLRFIEYEHKNIEKIFGSSISFKIWFVFLKICYSFNLLNEIFVEKYYYLFMLFIRQCSEFDSEEISASLTAHTINKNMFTDFVKDSIVIYANIQQKLPDFKMQESCFVMISILRLLKFKHNDIIADNFEKNKNLYICPSCVAKIFSKLQNYTMDEDRMNSKTHNQEVSRISDKFINIFFCVLDLILYNWSKICKKNADLELITKTLFLPHLRIIFRKYKSFFEDSEFFLDIDMLFTYIFYDKNLSIDGANEYYNILKNLENEILIHSKSLYKIVNHKSANKMIGGSTNDNNTIFNDASICDDKLPAKIRNYLGHLESEFRLHQLNPEKLNLVCFKKRLLKLLSKIENSMEKTSEYITLIEDIEKLNSYIDLLNHDISLQTLSNICDLLALYRLKASKRHAMK